MSANYPLFTYNGSSVILLPGRNFSKNELNSRLHQMEIDYDQSSLSKKYFTDLYDNALKYTNNLLKIFDRLQKDTNQYNYKTNNINRNIAQNYTETPIKNTQTKVTIVENKIINQDQQKYLPSSEAFSF